MHPHTNITKNNNSSWLTYCLKCKLSNTMLLSMNVRQHNTLTPTLNRTARSVIHLYITVHLAIINALNHASNACLHESVQKEHQKGNGLIMNAVTSATDQTYCQHYCLWKLTPRDIGVWAGELRYKKASRPNCTHHTDVNRHRSCTL